METMQALWLEDQIYSLRTDVPKPVPGKDEALIRVRLAGVCNTDLEMGRGYYPFTGVPGHEFVGDVVAAPDAPQWVGKRVVGEINVTCGTCEPCLSGRRHHCENRAAIGISGRNGVFAEYLTLPVLNLHVVPTNIPDDVAVFTEPLAAAVQIQEQVHIAPGTRVLVVGAGRLGLLIAQSLRLTGCALQVVVRHDYQRELLAQWHIAAVTEADVADRSMDVSVEVTGSPDGFALARRAVRGMGTMVLKSTYKGEMPVNFSSIVVDEITMVGSRCGSFAPALRLLERGLVDPRALIQARYPLSQGLRALDHAAERGVLKVLIQPS